MTSNEMLAPLPPIDPTTLVVGIGNKARHGKDSLGSMLLSALNLTGLFAKRYSFAD